MTKTPLSLLLASVLMSSAVASTGPHSLTQAGNLTLVDDVEINDPTTDLVGVTASGDRALVTVNGHTISLSKTGNHVDTLTGAQAENQGTITLTNATVSVAGPKFGHANGVVAQGQGSRITMTGGALNASGYEVYGAEATENAQADLQDVTITLKGERGAGLYAHEGATMTAKHVNITGTNADHGELSGAYLGDGTLTLEDATIAVNTRSGSYGIQARNINPDAPKGTLTVNNTTITATGDHTTGLLLERVDTTLNNVTVTNNGNNAYGIYFSAASADGNETLDATGLTITTGGQYSRTLYLSNGGIVRLNQSHITNNDETGIQFDGARQTISLELRDSTVKSGQATFFLHGTGTVTLFGTTTQSDANLFVHTYGENYLIRAHEGSKLNGVTKIDRKDNQLELQLSNSQWTVGGDADVTRLRLDAGSLVKLSRDLNTRTQGNTLTVRENLDAGGSTIEFRTFLGGDNSITDRLVVEGTFSHELIVDILGEGPGDQTQKGIELITIKGGTTTPDGIRLKAKPKAGDYEYDLVRGTGADANKWFLQSTKVAPLVDVDGGANPGGFTPPTLINPPTFGQAPTPPAMRPVDITDVVFVPAHFLWGELDTRDARTGGRLETTSGLWVRTTGEYAKDKTNQRAKLHDVGLQVGLDHVLTDTWSVSFVGDVGRAKADFDKPEHDAKNRRWGVGAIATRTVNDTYVEVATHFTQDRFTLNNGVEETKVRGHQWITSLEAGHRFMGQNVFLEPQVQIAYVRTHLKDYAVAGKTVQTDTLSGVGARLSLKVGNETPVASWWARADLLPRFGGKATMTVSEANFNAVTVEEKTRGMGVGVALGASAQLAPTWTLSTTLQATKHHHLKPGFNASVVLARYF